MKRSQQRHADKRRLRHARDEQREIQYYWRTVCGGHGIRWGRHTFAGIFPGEPM